MVFLFSSRVTPDKLDFMLQKPRGGIGEINANPSFSDGYRNLAVKCRAVSLLVKRSYKEGKLSYYDMYSDFGLTLGEHPRMMDDELNKLSVAILPLPGGEFYHYGTSRELIFFYIGSTKSGKTTSGRLCTRR